MFSGTSASHFILLALLIVATLPTKAQQLSPPSPSAQATKPPIPEDVLSDEHVREEFGVNDFTTPSIRKLFDMLNKVGKL
jgi:hypothetical protein